MSTKLKSLIPDAMVIIRLHELGLWERLCERTTVIVPSTIVHESRFYIDPDTGGRIEIDLEAQLVAGRITQEAADADEVEAFMRQFDPVMIENLHEGEVEALTLLFQGRAADSKLCSADQAAVKALVLVGMKQKGISLEHVLRETGLPGAGRIGVQYSAACFAQWVREAALDRLQGRGLARRPF